mgnify:CR=1 FL=1
MLLLCKFDVMISHAKSDIKMVEYRWKSRGSYGRTIHKTIKRLEDKFEKEADNEKMISLARTIGYLASVQRDFIKDEIDFTLEKRITELERKVNSQ